MTFSVNTNYGASIALQYLQKTNKELAQAQTRITTGLKVATARDDGAIFAIAQERRAEVSGYEVVIKSLDRGIAAVDVALAAGDALADILVDMRADALAATDASLTSSQHSAYNSNFKALRDQITEIIATANFNGLNLINGSGDLVVIANHDASNTIKVSDERLSLGGATITVGATEDIDTVAKANQILSKVDTSISNLTLALSRLGTEAKTLDIHHTFVTSLSDTLEAGIGQLVDADIARESTKLEALQTKQQLGIEALAIANSYPTLLLALFR